MAVGPQPRTIVPEAIRMSESARFLHVIKMATHKAKIGQLFKLKHNFLRNPSNVDIRPTNEGVLNVK